MDYLSKKRQLASIIEERLLPLIDNDYVLYGLPYYNNVGDILIWDGELEFLKKTSHKCLATCAWDSYPSTPLPENVIILITGGGYFGDLWRRAWEIVLAGIEINRNNKIIFLPNTIYYQDKAFLEKDSKFFSTFPNLTICARDNASFNLAKKAFSNNILLVPDMAFCMSEKFLLKHSHTPRKEVLLFKRTDKELPDSHMNVNEGCFDTHDWEPMEHTSTTELNIQRLLHRSHQLGKLIKLKGDSFEAWIYRTIYRRHMIKRGIRQIGNYKTIYTTRLHAMILGLMLGREINIIDNKFGKLGNFYTTWLKDCDNINRVQ